MIGVFIFKKNIFLIAQPKHKLWVRKKTHLNEMVLLSTQNECYNGWIKKYSKIYAPDCCLSGPVNTSSAFNLTMQSNLFN